MTIDSRHPDHTTLAPTWSRARDVLAGEDAVKAAAEKYLPRLESQTDDEYNAYRTRAAFFGATARTLEKCLALVFRHTPVLNIDAAPALAPFTQSVDSPSPTSSPPTSTTTASTPTTNTASTWPRSPPPG
jgi:hypothetical protein